MFSTIIVTKPAIEWYSLWRKNRVNESQDVEKAYQMCSTKTLQDQAVQLSLNSDLDNESNIKIGVAVTHPGRKKISVPKVTVKRYKPEEVNSLWFQLPFPSLPFKLIFIPVVEFLKRTGSSYALHLGELQLLPVPVSACHVHFVKLVPHPVRLLGKKFESLSYQQRCLAKIKNIWTKSHHLLVTMKRL